jgi:hypothetical protein
MFAEIKQTTLVFTILQLTGALGHGFVRKVTIDGVEYMPYLIERFWILKLTYFL